MHSIIILYYSPPREQETNDFTHTFQLKIKWFNTGRYSVPSGTPRTKSLTNKNKLCKNQQQPKTSRPLVNLLKGKAEGGRESTLS